MIEKKINQVEGFVLSIAEWSIKDLLLETLIDKDFFITQIFISNIEVKNLSLIRNNLEGNFKAFKVKVHFTTLYELQFDKVGHAISIPSISGEILFEKFNKDDFVYWIPNRVELGIENYLGVCGSKNFSYFRTLKSSNNEEIFKQGIEKKKKFEDFVQKFSRHVFPLGVNISQET